MRRTYFAIVGLAVGLIIVAFYSANSAVSLALVASSIGLIFATFRLKTATDNLVSATETMARNQILPRLSLSSSTWWGKEQSLTFSISNSGIGTAYGVKALGTTATGVKFSMESEEKRNDLLVGEYWHYGVKLLPSAYREFNVDFEYSDAKDYKYRQSIVIPKVSEVGTESQRET